MRFTSKNIRALFRLAAVSGTALLLNGCDSLRQLSNIDLEKAFDGQKEYLPPEAITPNETAMIQGLLGEDFSTEDMKKRFIVSRHKKENASVSLLNVDTANVILIYSKNGYRPDYGVMDTTRLFSSYPGTPADCLLHESVHTWQMRTGFSFTNKNVRDDLYEYGLHNNASFEQYGREQQAAMMQDYFRRLIHPMKLPSIHTQEIYGPDTPARDSLLMKTVEDFWPQAKETRLAAEKNPRACQPQAPVVFK